MCQKLRADLKRKHGENCIIYPEIAVTCLTQQKVAGSDRVYGIIDLLVIDEQGMPHIIDYKTSTKPYNKFTILRNFLIPIS
jgi:ATP-dependent exoDNAse (exonuclease V) beta subunit